jgi:hypothetical protein
VCSLDVARALVGPVHRSERPAAPNRTLFLRRSFSVSSAAAALVDEPAAYQLRCRQQGVLRGRPLSRVGLIAAVGACDITVVLHVALDLKPGRVRR